MSDERFDRIDQTLKGINQRFDGVDQTLKGMNQRFDGVDQTLKGIDQRFDSVDQRIDDLDRHVHVLHEEVVARIAAIPGYAGATKGEVAELRTEMRQRFEPLEAAVRHHSVEIEKLKQERG